jgi:hypothetical protein
MNESARKEWLLLLAEQAPALRAAGVLSVSIDGAAATFLPAEAAIAMAAAPTADDQRPREPTGDLTDPLNDPATFGGTLPGYVRERDPMLEVDA